RLAAIADAVAAEDWKSLVAAAHSLRGSCGTVGARRMAALAGQMEDEPPTTSSIASPLLAQLQDEYEAVRRAIDDAVAAARSAGAGRFSASAGGAAARTQVRTAVSSSRSRSGLLR